MHTQNLFRWRQGNGSGSDWISIYPSFWIRIRTDLYFPMRLDQDPLFCEIWNRFQIQVLKMHSTLEKNQQKHSLNVFLLMFGYFHLKISQTVKIIFLKNNVQESKRRYIHDIFAKREIRSLGFWIREPRIKMLDPDPYVKNTVSKRYANMHYSYWSKLM